MAEKDIILVITEQALPDEICQAITNDGYSLRQEPPGPQTSITVSRLSKQLAAILMDIDNPLEKETHFLTTYQDTPGFNRIPLIVITATNDQETEKACLEYGAWDFIPRTAFSTIVQRRIINAVHHSSLPLLRQLQHVTDYDRTSGIYNKEHFFTVTRQMLSEHPDLKFAMIHFDIEKFRLINAFFGSKEGDKFIVYIANHLKRYGDFYPMFTYGHISGDVFAFCMNFNDEIEIVTLATKIRDHMQKYSLPFMIVPVLGISIIKNNEDDIQHAFDQANLASKSCHGNFLKHFAFYEDSMNEDAIHDQYIVNNMVHALENHHFIVYLQPKYDLRTNYINGGEALVRWLHPKLGMISPGEFIPVFERNGFISRLDYYVWEEVCRMLRRWLDEGKDACPISVNISRVDLFNPKIVNIICNLADKYQIPHSLLQLELTESAYTSNPLVIKDVMDTLQNKGFTILMDDFGTGYSSLNVLKDIVVDILKIDMRFMSECDTPGRGENILGSIVRMAKWLDLPVIAEGVETVEQVNFLRNIGCEYVQGYYFAKPMSVEDFEKRAFINDSYVPEDKDYSSNISADDVWSATSQMETLFSNLMQAMALFEFDGKDAEILRGNDTYHDMFGYQEDRYLHRVFMNLVSQEDIRLILETFQTVARTHGTSECDFCRRPKNSPTSWINVKLKYINTIGTRDIILANLSDITSQKLLDMELLKYRTALASSQDKKLHVLIIDDEEVNRVILKTIFQDDFIISEASNGKEGLAFLKENSLPVDLILLDLIMPEMNGVTFLQNRMNIDEIANIPVVIITADNSTEQQSRLLEMGVRDYILKPFVPIVVRQRITNVIESLRNVGEKLQQSTK